MMIEISDKGVFTVKMTAAEARHLTVELGDVSNRKAVKLRQLYKQLYVIVQAMNIEVVE